MAAMGSTCRLIVIFVGGVRELTNRWHACPRVPLSRDWLYNGVLAAVGSTCRKGKECRCSGKQGRGPKPGQTDMSNRQTSRQTTIRQKRKNNVVLEVVEDNMWAFGCDYVDVNA